MEIEVKKPMKCSFCLRDETQIKELIAGPGGIYICDKCINLCHESISKKEAESESKPINFKDFTPKKIVEFLDQYIIGQNHAKKILSVIVYNHYKRIHHKEFMEYTDVEISKSNLMLIGPTGCGKTLFSQTIARTLEVPFADICATTLTQHGYVGNDPEICLLRLLINAQNNKEKAKNGIVYIDEVDKIARKAQTTGQGGSRDVSGEGVQQALLKLVEGTMATIPSPNPGIIKPGAQELNQLDTSNILFICGGSFEGLDKVIDQRMSKTSIGFGGKVKSAEDLEKENLIQHVDPEDLIKYGFLPEFIGRFPVIIALDTLDENALQKILLEPKNALIKQYQKMFKMDGVDLQFTDEAINIIAKKAISRKTGARGLRAILESILTDFMFEIPSNKDYKKLIVDKKVINDTIVTYSNENFSDLF